METPITAIGFSEIDKAYTLKELVEEVVEKPTQQQIGTSNKRDIIAEYIKNVDKDVNVIVRVVARAGVDNDSSNIEIEQCEPYLEASQTLDVEDLAVEEVEDEYNYYVIAEDSDTGIQFIFWLQNAIEYLEAKKENKELKKVAIAALATEGTIVLPVQQDDDDEKMLTEEKEKIKSMIKKAREGDEDAIKQLESEEEEMDQQLKERMYEEDFLTIMSGYFIPTTLEDANYAILGEIKEIKERKNELTGEEMYLFNLNVNDMPLEVMINKNELVGYPTVGMRFMGTAWLQGTIVIE